MRPPRQHIQLKVDVVVPEGMDPFSYECQLMWELERWMAREKREASIWIVPWRSAVMDTLRSVEPMEE